MISKNWLWVAIACMVIATVYQIVKLGGDNAAESGSPQAEQAFRPDQGVTNTASLAELPGILEEIRQPAPEPEQVEEKQQTPAPATESPDLSSETPGPVGSETPEPAEKAQQAEPAETARLPEPPVPTIDQPVAEIAPPVAALVESSNKGLVRGIVYSDQRGSALIGETIVRTGGTIDGVKVLRIYAGGVDFEKNGQRWTQKVSQTPDPHWR